MRYLKTALPHSQIDLQQPFVTIENNAEVFNENKDLRLF